MEDDPKLPTSSCAVREFSMQALPRCPIVSTLPHGVVVHDAQGAILMANPAAEEILGVSLSQMQGKTSLDPIWHCIHEDGSEYPGETHPGMVVLTTRQPMYGVIMGVFHPQKTDYIWIEINALPILSPDGYLNGAYATFTDITARIRHEASVREGWLAMDAVHDLVAVIDSDHRYRVVNQAFLAQRQATNQDIIGKHVREVLGEDVYERDIRERLDTCLTGTPVSFEMEMDYPHLGHRFLQVRYAPFRRPGHDHIDRIVTTITDVTASRQAAKKALESERYLRAIIETTAEGFWMVDKNGCFIDANATYCRMIGYTKEELLTLRARDVDPFLSDDEYSNKINRFLSGENAIFRTQHQRKDGTIYDVEISATWFPDRECIICFGHDITRQVEDEKRMQDSETWLRAILDTTADGFWVLDTAGRFLDVNDAYCRMSGYTRVEILNFSIPDIDVEEDLERARERITRVMQTGHERFVAHHRRKDGSVFPVEISTSWMGPAVGRFICFCHDITQEEQARQAIQYSHNMLQIVIEHMRSGVVVLDQNLHFMYVSQRFLKDYDVEKIDLIGRHHYDVFPDLPEKWRAIHRQVLAGSVLRNDNDPYQRADGRLMITEWECRPWYQQDGSIGGIILYTEDVTNKRRAESERLLLEAKLRNEQKLSSIGTMASGVAHEINNPLMGIINLAQLVEDRAPVEADSLRDYAREIRSEGERIAGIVSSLLTFSRRDDNSKMEYASPATLLQRVLTLTETLLVRQDIHVHKDIPVNLPLILCTQSQIQQILLNLVINARDAVNERFPEADPEKIIEISAGLLQKNGRALVRFSVVDHGQGIPKEIASHIFEPFFTTKPQGFGTGLGLSISYGIARSHGGELSYEKLPSGQTAFHLDLPVNHQDSI